MSKRAVVISIILIILIVMSSCRSDIKYSAGRDTIKLYGDGTFQIIGRNPPGVYYGGEGSPLISYVDLYYETDDMVYIVGHQWHEEDIVIYGIIDTNENIIDVYFSEEVYLADRLLESTAIVFLEDFSDFPEDDQEILNKMINGEIGNAIVKKTEDGSLP